MKRLALGLGSLVLVLALLVGIPAALLFLAGNPFPSGDELSRALSTPDYGGEFLVGTLLPLIAWVAWATFALGFLVELPGHIRGIPSPHLPGLGLQQLWAAALIGAIVVMLTGVGALAGSTAGSPASAPASVSVSQSGTGATFGSTQAHGGTGAGSTDSAAVSIDTTVEAAPAAPIAAAPTYVVQPGDSLWRIAEQHLGSGERFAEIAGLNLGVAQGDGHSLTAENWLNAGWVLTLPADAAVPAAPEAATPAEHVVVEGDTLWDLAADAYGDGTRYPEIVAASAAVVQPDGATITDPNLIQPGETVNLPGVGAPTPDAVAGTAAASPVAEGVPVGATIEAASPTVTPAVAAPVDASAGVEANAAGAAAFSHTAPAHTTGGIGAVLAVGLLGLLGLRRAGQRGRREFGRRIALPTAEASTLELELRAVENRMGLDDIDHALRYLAVWAEDTGRTLPSIEAIRLADDDVTLYLSGTDPLPRPFRTEAVPANVVPANSTTAWTIDRAALPGVERVPQPPYPAFVTLGQDQAGAHILVDLERLGTLGVTGPPELRLGVLTAIAAELATSRRSEIRVTVVGAADDLATALASPRLRHVPDVATLLAHPAGDGLAAETPEIVILALAQPLSDRQRAALAARSARLGIVQSGSTARAAAAPDRAPWTLNVDDIGAARLLPVGLSLAPQLLGAAECTRLIELFRSTAAHSVTGPEWARQMGAAGVGGAGSTGTAEAADVGASGAPWIRLLGPVEVIGARGVEPRGTAGGAELFRLPWATELVAFFTVHRTASAVDVQTALWPADLPTGLAAQQNRNALTNETRAWLGDSTDDEPYLPVVGADGLRLHPDVQSDWDVWRQLLGDDVTLTTTATLVSALRLVTGEPLSGLPTNHFVWAEPLREEITGAVLDAADELAARARISGDADSAALAASARGLVEPVPLVEPAALVEPVETR
ncbi:MULTISPECIES: LysM peptidoglycan-binding domain-containing protein [Cryobacterium]|uniref:LysM peptidoglycan-binding domain-containing protein n=1 Tax=Cryobacterium TaxID=69578 RepID=UPI0013FDE888|nr:MULTISPECIES: LysM peptidoglycan-binding domain-containing protein [Cryobacterium]